MTPGRLGVVALLLVEGQSLTPCARLDVLGVEPETTYQDGDSRIALIN